MKRKIKRCENGLCTFRQFFFFLLQTEKEKNTPKTRLFSFCSIFFKCKKIPKYLNIQRPGLLFFNIWNTSHLLGGVGGVAVRCTGYHPLEKIHLLTHWSSDLLWGITSVFVLVSVSFVEHLFLLIYYGYEAESLWGMHQVDATRERIPLSYVFYPNLQSLSKKGPPFHLSAPKPLLRDLSGLSPTARIHAC